MRTRLSVIRINTLEYHRWLFFFMLVTRVYRDFLSFFSHIAFTINFLCTTPLQFRYSSQVLLCGRSDTPCKNGLELNRRLAKALCWK